MCDRKKNQENEMYQKTESTWFRLSAWTTKKKKKGKIMFFAEAWEQIKIAHSDPSHPTLKWISLPVE